MKKLLLFLCTAAVAFAAAGSAVSGSVSVTIPNAAPYNATATLPMRWELRVHDFNTGVSGWPQSPNPLARLGPVVLQGVYGSNTVQAGIVDWIDSVYNNGPEIGGCCSGKTDQLIRVQRDVAASKYTLEICDVTGGACRTETATIYSTAASIAGKVISLDAGKMSFLRWYSTVVPVGTQIPISGPAGDLGNWEFEGTLADSSGHGLDMTGTPTYTTSPLYAPSCNPGKAQTFKVGGAGTLNAAGSFTFDGSTPTLTWTQVSGPTTVNFTSATSATPGVTGFGQFGTYVFGLTVRDQSNQSASCEVRDGAVVVDSNDVVITNNTVIDTLLGPQIRWGGNPWPWYDDRHRAEAEYQKGNMDTFYATGSYAYMFDSKPANYYDVVAAYYSLYYRSGIDTWRDEARKLADRWWAGPRLLEGTDCNAWQDGNTCWQARSISALGLILRATDGRSDMWPGLRIIFNSYRTYYMEGADITWGFWDTREMLYHLATVSYCAMFDPDAGQRALCKSSIQTALNETWTPAYDATPGAVPFAMLYYSRGTWDAANLGQSATVVNGNRTVTTTGTAWDASSFVCHNGEGNEQPCVIWFTNIAPGTKPASNADGDPTYYKAEYVDATTLLLDRPYEGQGGVKGFGLGDPNTNYVGYGGQPFILGLVGMAMDFAGRAIVDVNPTLAATARGYNVAIANWIKDYGYHPAWKAMWYAVGQINCPSGAIPENEFTCNAGFGIVEARMDNAEAMRSVQMAYEYTRDSALKTFGDAIYSAMWSKPGTGSPNEDSNYLNTFEDGSFYLSGTPPWNGGDHKYFGMGFGLSGGSAWPAIRMGGSGAPVGDSTCKRRVNGRGKVIGNCTIH